MGCPFPSPGDLPDPGIEPASPTFQADALTAEPPGKLVSSLRAEINLVSTSLVLGDTGGAESTDNLLSALSEIFCSKRVLPLETN